MADLQVEDDWAQENDQEMEEDEDDDILGLNDEDQEDEAALARMVVLMKFCPHDSSMLYPQV